ncbi:UDP-N-acetylglucosamine pyrophosphorylase [Escovopsis weberi]|uniref:UDP-N-acetylglucosamine diphosphorylase n=1 Tax=Escovopsis weberi TaxID=150374 RepID=A0A0M8MU33_ESCWE|nr:UDP-N-acetylglucosamine pyrophosphorylase [Escovopsis weberi]
MASLTNGVRPATNGCGPKAPSQEAVAQLREKYTSAGQGHVFTFYDSLTSEEQSDFYKQLSGFDPAYITEIADRAINPPKTDGAEAKLEQLPESAQASILDSSRDDIDKWYESGLDLIGKNEVAVVLMAGGQGTRLGSSAPKGCYDIGLPSAKSLFQIQAERICKIQDLASNKAGAKAVVPWYIMTSGPTRQPTEDFFTQNDFFGLDKDNVKFFNQGVLPCISNDGKILLETKGRVAVAPDGNGGIYQALVAHGVLEDMRKRNIKHIHAYCVDNCLVKVADPVFIGFSASLQVDIATKVVRKRNATESVGLILCKNGKPDVVEYSEIDKETAEAKDPHNPELLKFRAANIVNHYYSLSFLESVPQWVQKLPHHVARKKIPSTDLESGELVKPQKPNGIKLEQFIFDVFPLLPLEKFACFEVNRSDEFSPLKNGSGAGEDCPETSRADIMAQGLGWIKAAGATVESQTGIEVSPLVSYGGEGLEKLKGQHLTSSSLVELA